MIIIELNTGLIRSLAWKRLKDVAEEVGINKATLSGLLSGKISIRLEMLNKLASVLEVNASNLLIEKEVKHFATCPKIKKEKA